MIIVTALLRHVSTDLEADGFIGLGSKEKVLPLSIWRLHPLLVRRHKAMSGHNTVHYLGVIDLEKQAVLVCVWVSLFGN